MTAYGVFISAPVNFHIKKTKCFPTSGIEVVTYCGLLSVCVKHSNGNVKVAKWMIRSVFGQGHEISERDM